LIPPVEFKRACYAVAQADGGSIEGFDASLISRNFYMATLKTSTDRFVVLCNCIHPYLAFMCFDPAFVRLGCVPFTEPTHLGALFAALTKFEPLDAGWLMSELQDYMLESLTTVEREQVRYWKPTIVGEVVFHNWD